MKAFKRIFSIFMALILLLLPLAACDTPSAEGDTTIINDAADETTSSEEQTGKPYEPDGYRGNLMFRNTADFYTYFTTGSENPADYIDERSIILINAVDKYEHPTKLLKIEDLIPNEDLTSQLEYVELAMTRYEYVLKYNNDGSYHVIIGIAPEETAKSPDVWTQQFIEEYPDAVFYQEGETVKFSPLTTQYNVFYAREISNVPIFRVCFERCIVIHMYIDGCAISLSIANGNYSGRYPSIEEIMNDQNYQCVTDFFTDDRVEEAVQNWISVVRNHQADQ